MKMNTHLANAANEWLNDFDERNSRVWTKTSILSGSYPANAPAIYTAQRWMYKCENQQTYRPHCGEMSSYSRNHLR